eukprot:scaffold24803_cov87-Skeletonema_marinoi.AAC.2
MTKKELHHSHQDDEPFNNDCLSVSESASPRPMTSSGPLAHSTQRLSQTVHSAYCPAVHDHVHVHSLSYYSASNILHYIVIKKSEHQLQLKMKQSIPIAHLLLALYMLCSTYHIVTAFGVHQPIRSKSHRG